MINHEIRQLDPPKKGTAFDLLLYLFGGFGLFIITGYFVSQNLLSVGIQLTLVSVLMNLVFVGGSAIVLGIMRGKISWEQLGIRPARWKKGYWWGVAVITFGLLPIRGLAGALAQYLFDPSLESLQARSDLLFGAGPSLSMFLVTFIGAGILAPISEELYFRGLLHTWFRQRMGMWPTILFSTGLFALAHFDSPGVVVSSFIVGLAMAYAFEKTASLWVTIAIHMLTNSFAVVLTFLVMWLGEIFNFSI